MPSEERPVWSVGKGHEHIPRGERGVNMADEYIRKQDTLDAFGLSEKTRKYGGDHSGYDTRMLYEIQDTIESLEPANVVPVEILKAEIYKLKCRQDSENQDYYTGYMSALSTVEGILAEMDREE